MAQFTWPTVTVNANNASVGVNGDGAPLSSTQIGVVDSNGDLQPVTQGQALMAASLPVVIASNQSTLPVSAASLPLPSGAATAANQATQIGIETDIEANTGNTASSVASLNSKVTVVDTGDVTIVSSVLPTGAATEATLASVDGGVQTISGQLPLTIGQKTMATSLGVALASNQSAIPVTQSGTWSVGAATPAAGTVTQAAVSVGTSAVRCTVSGSAPNSARKVLMVTPIASSTAAFYIGSSSVTSSGSTRGIPILPGQTFIANSDAGDYYIISDTTSQTVFIMEQV